MWTELYYSKGKINKAGEMLVNKSANQSENDWAIKVINTWRTAHAYPLVIFNNTLRNKVRDIDQNAIVVQRLKKLSSIINKLELKPKMKLCRMQDIGGCRVIVQDVEKVYLLRDAYLHSRVRHTLKNTKDYIKTPREDTGYRGIHLMYEYKSEKRKEYNGLNIEIQIRTKLQHIWATAVETVGLMTNNALKSSQGQPQWLRFFSLMSSYFATLEGTSIVADTPSNTKTLINEIKQIDEEHDILVKLAGVKATVRTIQNNTLVGKVYYLLVLDYKEMKLHITPYERDNLKLATADYARQEKINMGKKRDVVLVSGTSIEALRKAYPNYFIDIDEFLKHFTRVLKT